MARTVKPEEFAAKRREILDAAYRLVFTKGFEQMSIQDIQKELGISSGAFHHYFGSRDALLQGFIERIQEESGKPLLALIGDPTQSAVEKFQGFFNTLDSLRVSQKAEILRLSKVWYTDANALVRQKVDEAIFAQRAPMIAAIVRQGVREGVFNTENPDKAGQVILSLVQGMGNVHAKLMLSLLPEAGLPDEQVPGVVNEIIATYSAYMGAIERVLGAPPHSLQRTDSEAVHIWVSAIRDNPKGPEKNIKEENGS